MFRRSSARPKKRVVPLFTKDSRVASGLLYLVILWFVGVDCMRACGVAWMLCDVSDFCIRIRIFVTKHRRFYEFCRRFGKRIAL